MKALLAVVLLAGCAMPASDEPMWAAVPVALQVCPDPAFVPLPPPRIRTVEAVGAWAVATDRARQQTEAARAECSRRLDRLNEWISQQRTIP